MYRHIVVYLAGRRWQFHHYRPRWIASAIAFPIERSSTRAGGEQHHSKRHRSHATDQGAEYASNRRAFPPTTLGSQLREIAQIIRGRNQFGVNRQVFFASLGGFDTHSYQLATHNGLLQQLNDAMVAFDNAMADSSIAAADQVTVFTQSEFGRTLQPNTNGGTDHAWGSHHLVLGGAVKSGIYGQFPDLTVGGDLDCGFRGNWIPTTALDQYAATLASWFGVSNPDSIFTNLPAFAQPTLGFL